MCQLRGRGGESRGAGPGREGRRGDPAPIPELPAGRDPGVSGDEPRKRFKRTEMIFCGPQHPPLANRVQDKEEERTGEEGSCVHFWGAGLGGGDRNPEEAAVGEGPQGKGVGKVESRTNG